MEEELKSSNIEFMPNWQQCVNLHQDKPWGPPNLGGTGSNIYAIGNTDFAKLANVMFNRANRTKKLMDPQSDPCVV